MDAIEENNLKDHWSNLSHDFLDSYLIQDHENPAINPQSVFIRGCLIDRIFNTDYADLINGEIAYSACACHALQLLEKGTLPELVSVAKHQNSVLTPPAFIADMLREPDFDLYALLSEIAKCSVLGFEYFSSPFEARWNSWISGRPGTSFSLLEVGCGSANDYRYWRAFGLADYVKYTGVDICGRNIENARKHFPSVEFHEANGCDLDFKDQSFDVTLCFDLLEHLSPEGAREMLSELARLSRDEIWISLFSGTPGVESEYRRKDNYYWNTLSVMEIVEFLKGCGFSSTIMSIATELESRFPGYSHYNAGAFLILANRNEH